MELNGIRNRLSVIRDFVNPGLPGDMETRSWGNAEDIFDVQRNAYIAMSGMVELLKDLLNTHQTQNQRWTLPVRTEVAAKEVILGSALISSALLLHLREVTWTQGPALIILRSAIEATAKGGWVAIGLDDEPFQIMKGNAHTRPCLESVDKHLITKGEVIRVYAWLCNFTLLDYRVINVPPPSDADVYAAAAYIAWINATLAVEIIGPMGMTAQKPRLPAKVPWNP